MAQDQAGWTPLHVASEVGAETSVRVLVQTGAAMEAKGSISGRTPLHEACASVRQELVSQLLLLGADELAVDNDGHTPSDLVGRWILPGENVRAEEKVRETLERAPADRRWRRRRLLLLLRWRPPPSISCAASDEVLGRSGGLDNDVRLRLPQRDTEHWHSSAGVAGASDEAKGTSKEAIVPPAASSTLSELVCEEQRTVGAGESQERSYPDITGWRAPVSRACGEWRRQESGEGLLKSPPLISTTVSSKEQGGVAMHSAFHRSQPEAAGSMIIGTGGRNSWGSIASAPQPCAPPNAEGGENNAEVQVYREKQMAALRLLICSTIDLPEGVFRNVLSCL